VGKFYIFRVALASDLIWLALVGAITSLISAFYYLRVIVTMYMRSGKPATHSETWLNISVALAALATFVLGVFPGPLLALVQQARMMFLP